MILKKKILIITHGFYPEQSPRAFRATELAKEFSRQGHDVTVMAPERDNLQDLLSTYPINYVSLGHFKWRVFNFKGLGFFGRLYNKVVNRMLPLLFEYPMIEFIPKIKKAFKKNTKTYDLLISVAVPYPIHWGVAAIWESTLKNKIGIWAADCGDPFMGQENDTFKLPFYFKYVEKWFCKKVDFLTIPVATAIPAYYPEFHNKIKIISQGFNFEEIELAPYKQNTFPHFAYAGGLIPGRRDPKEFLEFLVNYSHPYKFDIYTKQVSLVQSFADRSQGRIEIKEYLPRKELLFELSKLEFVVNFENLGQKQIPSKIIDYVIIKKPILSINTFNFNKQSAEEFLSGHYKTGLRIENPEQYRIENVAEAFLKLAKG
jgi:hypothetical protein